MLAQLGAHPGPLFESSSFTRQPRETTTRQFKAFLRGHRLALALDQLDDDTTSIVQKLRQLSSLDLVDESKGKEEAWDCLLEVEVAARMRFGPIRPRLADVDLLFEDGDGSRFGAECKRPRQAAKIPQRVRDACGQLRKRSLGGIVVVGVDHLLPDVIRLSGSDSSARIGRRLIEKAIGSEIESTRQALSVNSGGPILQAIWGVVVCAPFFTYTHVSATEGVANFSFATRLIANPAVPNAHQLLLHLDQSLKIGQMELNQSKLSGSRDHDSM